MILKYSKISVLRMHGEKESHMLKYQCSNMDDYFLFIIMNKYYEHRSTFYFYS